MKFPQDARSMDEFLYEYMDASFFVHDPLDKLPPKQTSGTLKKDLVYKKSPRVPKSTLFRVSNGRLDSVGSIPPPHKQDAILANEGNFFC